MSLLTLMKGLPLAYNKDMQEDKEPLFDAIDTLRPGGSGDATRRWRPRSSARDRMLAATRGDFSTATDLADYLVRQGLPFREAHEIVGKVVQHCTEHKIGLEDLDGTDPGHLLAAAPAQHRGGAGRPDGAVLRRRPNLARGNRSHRRPQAVATGARAVRAAT